MSNVLSIIREHTQGMGEMFPGMSLLRASYDVATTGDLSKAGLQKAFSKHISSFDDPKEAIKAVKKFTPFFDPSGETGKLLDVVGKADTNFQKGFQTALSNPEFLDYMQKGGSSLLDQKTLESLALDPARAMERGFATQLLDQIGTNDMFRGAQASENFEKLDKLGEKIQDLGKIYKKLDGEKDAKKKAALQEEIMQKQMLMANDLRELGVNVPEDVSPEILQAFKNILIHGMSTDQAMDHLMIQLAEKGIDPEAIRSLDAMMRPMAGIMDFIAQPYAEFFRKHGPAIGDKFDTMMAHGDNINRGIFNGERFVTDPAQRTANVQAIQREQQERKNPTLGQKEAEEAGAKGKDLDGKEIKVSSYDDRGIAQKPFENASLGVSVGHVAQTPAWAQHADNANTFRPQQFGLTG